jgi:hypothetical protein
MGPMPLSEAQAAKADRLRENEIYQEWLVSQLFLLSHSLVFVCHSLEGLLCCLTAIVLILSLHCRLRSNVAMQRNGFLCERPIGAPPLLYYLHPYFHLLQCVLTHHNWARHMSSNRTCRYREVGGRSAAIEDSDRIVLFEDVRDYLFLFSDEKLKLEVHLPLLVPSTAIACCHCLC